MISVSKNMFLDKLGHIFNKYNNTYYSTTKIKPVDVKWSTYIEFIAKKQYVRICWWSCKNIKIWKIVQKGYTANWSEEDFVIKKIGNTGHRRMLL